MRAHGTRSCYSAGCRRPECVQANARYAAARLRRGLVDESSPDMVDADPIRRRLRALEDAGWTVRRVAEATGIAKSQIARIRSGEAKRVRRETAAAIMEQTPAPTQPRNRARKPAAARSAPVWT
jgi:hypothetical protein